MKKKVLAFTASAFFILSLQGCFPPPAECGKNNKELRTFRRVFSWGHPTDDETARKYREIGVTDLPAANEKQALLALKHGMTPYCGTITQSGKYPQVMTSGEQELFSYINGKDLDKKLTPSGKEKILDRRRIEKKSRYGGEPDAPLDVVTSVAMPCFQSDTNLTLSKRRIDRTIARVPSAKGIYFDYFGYTNYKGCYCGLCRKLYAGYLAEKKLSDTPENRDAFYRDELVKYVNSLIDYVKTKRPGFKVVIHIYPTLLSEPLYGNRIKADYCGQTVAWYFPWDLKKVKRYTAKVVNEAQKYHSGVKGIPFAGLKSKPGGSLVRKSPETLEKELKTILEAGGDSLMVCNGKDMLDPGYYGVFKKYSNIDPAIKRLTNSREKIANGKNIF